MKNLLLFVSIALFVSCGTTKNTSTENGTAILYSKHSEKLNGTLEVKLMSGTSIQCEANIIQLYSSTYDVKELSLRATNGITTLKLLDEKSYYFTPNCNGKKVELIVFHSKNGTDTYLATVKVKVP